MIWSRYGFNYRLDLKKFVLLVGFLLFTFFLGGGGRGSAQEKFGEWWLRDSFLLLGGEFVIVGEGREIEDVLNQ